MNVINCDACKAPIHTNKEIVEMAAEGHAFWCRGCLRKFFNESENSDE